METTWKPVNEDESGTLSSGEKRSLPDSAFAFPESRKEPLVDADHVRNAIARFDQVKGASDKEREQAFGNLRKAAKHFDIDMSETDWHQLGKPSQ
ncbi:hypothetical protein Ais01nite_49910 [Asanoa ishikariensis]|uniref:Uncharacterized protein n=1 Tax=Asanoa ishikariensis TaxID=137265 RepID=A0A1H3RRF2_9ACTN|nr:DUF6582 domain-containing protein [Asanoa ishikariensis]GIF66956.1 hypothetical protein Ais01nite_49910 [Asanoa ishikariensis]SDZ27828.1 hypothetical protein SAMN05421684_4091 [Asanoa ishikariensis]